MRSARFKLPLVLLGISSCARPVSEVAPAAQIYDVLAGQARAWNAGDIDAFMEPYRRSPELTFVSDGRVTRGWRATLERYHHRYPDRQTMGRLRFTDVAVTPLGSDAALVLGRWALTRDEPIGGVFTLVWRRENDRWVIIHDHTSTHPHAPSPPSPERLPARDGTEHNGRP